MPLLRQKQSSPMQLSGPVLIKHYDKPQVKLRGFHPFDISENATGKHIQETKILEVNIHLLLQYTCIVYILPHTFISISRMSIKLGLFAGLIVVIHLYIMKLNVHLSFQVISVAEFF